MSHHSTIFSETFIRLGLKPVHTEIYEALLRLGQVTAGALAKDTGIARATLYGHLDTMKAVGVLLEQELSSTTVYSAVQPARLSLMLENQENALALTRKELALNLETYQPQKSDNTSWEVEVYDFEKGMIQLQGFLQQTKEFQALVPERFEEVLNSLFRITENTSGQVLVSDEIDVLLEDNSDIEIKMHSAQHWAPLAKIASPQMLCVIDQQQQVAFFQHHVLIAEFQSHFEGLWKQGVKFRAEK